MERRKAQLEKMLEESHSKLANHHAGEDVMEQEVSRLFFGPPTGILLHSC
jgi:hypothetical protein